MDKEKELKIRKDDLTKVEAFVGKLKSRQYCRLFTASTFRMRRKKKRSEREARRDWDEEATLMFCRLASSSLVILSARSTKYEKTEGCEQSNNSDETMILDKKVTIYKLLHTVKYILLVT